MKLYDIKSRDRKSFSVQMDAHVPNIVGTRVTRMVRRLDRVTGELLPREESKKFPPVITWRAGETKVGLPSEVISHPVVASRLRNRRLVIVREYDPAKPEEKPQMPAPAGEPVRANIAAESITARKRPRRRGAEE